MRFLSLCSGIEAASVAWAPLGWKAAAVAEIEAFPSAVLAHHYPDVPNLGDITKFKEWPDLGTIDLICGGTPCQSFSIAGLRKGLADPRGNLSLTFLAIVDRYRPRYFVWENVPGVFSSTSYDAPDPCPPPAPMDLGCDGAEMDTDDEFDSEELHAFNSFLAGVSELGYGWAYVVRDAQYVRVDGLGRAVPQRRRRVIVVGCLGDWRRAAAVLLEPESLFGDSPPRREAGQGTARPIGAGSPSSSGYRNDADTAENLIAFGGNNCSGPIESQSGVRLDDVHATLDSNNGSRRHNGVMSGWAVRRLMPVECERLMGFPDGYTDIPYRGKPAADGPRYKALGNSWAVNVARWVGRRIEMVEQIASEHVAEAAE